MRDKALKVIEGLGGLANIKDCEGCITRIRCTVVDAKLVNDKVLKAAGAIAVMKMGTAIQVIIGTYADLIAGEMNKIRKGQ
jgi:PTS system N-acetylglucosamine-specific IIB component